MSTSTYPGGAEKMLLRTLRALRARGGAPRVECRTICIQPLGAVGRQLRDEGHDVVALDAPSPRGLVGYATWLPAELRGILRVRRTMREFRPHLVHGWLPRGSLVARTAAAFTGVPVACDVQIAHDPRRWQARLDGLTRSLNDIWIACGEAVADFHAREARVRRDRIVVVPNALEAAELAVPPGASTFRTRHDLAPDAEVVAFAGRLHEQKGLRSLLGAVAALRARPRLRCVIAGDGPQRASLEREAADLGLAGVVAFVGHLAEPRELLATTDVFCLPSDYEGLPLVLLEAMALRRACVASRIPGVTEVVTDQVDGLLVPPRDTHALARALARVLDEGALRAALGEAAHRRIVGEYLMETHVERLLGAYARALSVRR